eukprot:CAMPEP_0185580370 /NCGR_PEP_ID=MMETSP0434-20130131/16267_1 /TAXON_ID=626734 ORGANISM="Favella taraikaensis, Strain Fe Narragansett Bay" /NCGR_SAMPLE_ID=MMETSP0434 /ASSEMBLY_ACC=CAM_ASM_000379 /LENGTH=165 /DNA_ID=CAMNT_0028198607 /DNA_START=26 /DNA_END=523 /DNA_ORIENTATION=+
MADDEDFTATDAGASDTYPIRAGEVKKGSHVVIKGHPCKVIDYSTSKTGKHGHAKAKIVALDVFTHRKYEDICPTSHNMTAPNVKRTEWQLLDISDGFASLMDPESGETLESLKLPPDETADLDEEVKAYQKLIEEFEAGEKDIMVTVVSAMGTDMILSQYKATE